LESTESKILERSESEILDNRNWESEILESRSWCFTSDSTTLYYLWQVHCPFFELPCKETCWYIRLTREWEWVHQGCQGRFTEVGPDPD